MTLDESLNFSTLFYWLFGWELSPGVRVTDAQARDAAAWLAKRSHKVMGGGPTTEDILRAWPDQTLGLWGQSFAVAVVLHADPERN
jgi:hypothetical protein